MNFKNAKESETVKHEMQKSKQPLLNACLSGLYSTNCMSLFNPVVKWWHFLQLVFLVYQLWKKQNCWNKIPSHGKQ